ncbi:MAG: PP2C family protein-serine/threonine phosphatase [Gloeomargarita sp. HHBFW_bins_162]
MKILSYRQRFGLLILIMNAVTLVVAGLVMLILFRATLRENLERLQETNTSQARLLEEIYWQTRGSENMIVNVAKEASRRFTGTARTGEFVVLRPQPGDRFEILVSRWNQIEDELQIQIIPREAVVNSGGLLAVMANQPTSPYVGIVQLPTGVRVLAAIEPVRGLNWVLANQIHLSEVRAPFLHASMYALAAAIMVNGLGAFVFLRVSNPMVRRLERLNEELEERVHQRTAELAQANAQIQHLNAQLHSDNLRLSAELDVARRLQMLSLPRPEELAHSHQLAVSGAMYPATEVGGDYYDVYPQGQTTWLSIGDITGHGLESGVLMLMTQVALRTLLTNGETGGVQMLNTLNRVIYDSMERLGYGRTLTLTLLHHEQGQLCITGQHEEVIILRTNGDWERIDTLELGFPLGLERDIQPYVHQRTVQLHPGEGGILFTDGITEAENPQGDLYGIERLCQVAQRHWHQPVVTIQQAIVTDVKNFIATAAILDDIAVVVFKFQPDGTYPQSQDAPPAES